MITELPATIEITLNGVTEIVPAYLDEQAAANDQAYLGHAVIPVENETRDYWTAQEVDGFTTLTVPIANARSIIPMPSNPHPGAYPNAWDQNVAAYNENVPGVGSWGVLLLCIAKIIAWLVLGVVMANVLRDVLFHAIDKSTEFSVHPADPNDPTNPNDYVCVGTSCQIINRETGDILGSFKGSDPLMTIMIVGMVGIGGIVLLATVVPALLRRGLGGGDK